MTKKVFISHKDLDSHIAEKVAARVRMNGMETYLDTIDDALIEDGPDLSDILLERMGECHQLIAVVSDKTKNSWWVPWEIGVGSEKGFRMASYSESYIELPSYLQKWPALHNDEHIDLYCVYSKNTDNIVKRRQIYESVSNENYSSIRKSEALDFHKRLKSAIR